MKRCSLLWAVLSLGLLLVTGCGRTDSGEAGSTGKVTSGSADEVDGSAGRNVGGSRDGSVGGNKDGKVSGDAGGSLGGSAGEGTGGSLGGSAGEGTGGSLSGSAGAGTDGSAGGSLSGSAGEGTGGSLGGGAGGSLNGSAGTDTDGSGGNSEAAEAGRYVPVAEYTMLSVPDRDIGGANGSCLRVGNEIYYLQMDEADNLNGPGGRWQASILAVPADGTGGPRTVAGGTREYFITDFYVDEESNLYLFVDEGYYDEELGERLYRYYLEKRDRDGQTLFRTDVTEVLMAADSEALWETSKVYADREGNIALLCFDAGQACFFDSGGQYRSGAKLANGAESHHVADNVVCAGERSFLWAFDLFRKSVLLWEVDLQEGTVAREKAVDVSSLGSLTSGSDVALFSGGERGLLLSMRDVLWQYDPETEETVEIFRWDDENVELDGSCVAWLDMGTGGGEGSSMELLVYEDCVRTSRYEGLMSVRIAYRDRAELPERQRVSIGIRSASGKIENTVRRFNRLNGAYKAVLTQYDGDSLRELLLYGKEVPDLLDVTGLRTEWLDSKGLLEDLVPYFEKSGVAGREEILPCVWELLEKDGKLTRMASGFQIRTLITTADIPEDGWDYELYLGLGERYPESRYFNAYNPMQVWGAVSVTAVRDYVDWEGGRCSFDSVEFQALLEEIMRLDYPKNQVGAGRVTNSREELEKLMTGQVLFQIENYGSAHGYDGRQWDSGGRIKSVGYPTGDGASAFLFSPSQTFAIYGESGAKDGAWAFLEFLLSKEEQTWYGMEKEVFPVHGEAFEEYLTRDFYLSSGNVYVGDLVETLEDTPDKIRFMAEHMVISQNAADEIHMILTEELQAYFEGDKTVQEAVRIIQNRVQLYLDEM